MRTTLPAWFLNKETCWFLNKETYNCLEHCKVSWKIFGLSFHLEIHLDNLGTNGQILFQCSKINPIQPSVVFHIETNHSPNQMTGFYMKCNAGLKWVDLVPFKVNAPIILKLVIIFALQINLSVYIGCKH